MKPIVVDSTLNPGAETLVCAIGLATDGQWILPENMRLALRMILDRLFVDVPLPQDRRAAIGVLTRVGHVLLSPRADRERGLTPDHFNHLAERCILDDLGGGQAPPRSLAILALAAALGSPIFDKFNDDGLLRWFFGPALGNRNLASFVGPKMRYWLFAPGGRGPQLLDRRGGYNSHMLDVIRATIGKYGPEMAGPKQARAPGPQAIAQTQRSKYRISYGHSILAGTGGNFESFALAGTFFPAEVDHHWGLPPISLFTIAPDLAPDGNLGVDISFVPAPDLLSLRRHYLTVMFEGRVVFRDLITPSDQFEVHVDLGNPRPDPNGLCSLGIQIWPPLRPADLQSQDTRLLGAGFRQIRFGAG